jgi:hypothetical protein
MPPYKCPNCGRVYQTHEYCNHHHISVLCDDIGSSRYQKSPIFYPKNPEREKYDSDLKLLRKKDTWKGMSKIWITNPIEVIKYIFKKLFKHPTPEVNNLHFFSVILLVITVYLIIELYRNSIQIPLNFIYEFLLVILIIGLFFGSYIYCWNKSVRENPER